MVSRVNQLEFRDGGANEAQGLDKTEAVRVKVSAESSLVHDTADDKMSQESGIQLLNDADGLEGAQRAGQQTLVNLQLIQGDFDLPAFVIQHYQVKGWVGGWVKQGGDEPMVL